PALRRGQDDYGRRRERNRASRRRRAGEVRTRSGAQAVRAGRRFPQVPQREDPRDPRLGGKAGVLTQIAVLPGDGIGPEVTAAAVRVLDAAHPGLTFVEAPVGANAIANPKIGAPLPAETLRVCSESAAILFGAV